MIVEGALEEQDNESRWLKLVWVIRKDLPFLCCFEGSQDIVSVLDINSRVIPFTRSQSLVVWEAMRALVRLPCRTQGTQYQSVPAKKRPNYWACCCGGAVVCPGVEKTCYGLSEGMASKYPVLQPELCYMSQLSGLLGHLYSFWTASLDHVGPLPAYEGV